MTIAPPDGNQMVCWFDPTAYVPDECGAGWSLDLARVVAARHPDVDTPPVVARYHLAYGLVIVDSDYSEGDRVIGLGRNGREWTDRPTGEVTQVGADYVRVQWDNCCVEDDMLPGELERAR